MARMTHKGTCSGASTNSFQSISFITEATGHAHSGIDYLSPSLFGVSGLQESCLPSA
ncbi:hypothetical protein PCASD_02852 [Puccinia coronata f. sp. avenae]|uniref:Uncharacterized protein n=1 Tax=Puccinia coronata f. sp. avenae TaxID=200324 RepID=A0A2N5VEA4_9BASI|nr:hypothetical protein PCASD_02852 [Puccinia coronata f. sp. avenae]